jgi:hypothetical protein
MLPKLYSPVERAREKAESRAEDARALATGEKSAEQLSRENASFAFAGAKIRFADRRR